VNIAERDASEVEIGHVCEIVQVTEFLDKLPEGYDTMPGRMVLGCRAGRNSGLRSRGRC